MADWTYTTAFVSIIVFFTCVLGELYLIWAFNGAMHYSWAYF
jgi:hypothetical protein